MKRAKPGNKSKKTHRSKKSAKPKATVKKLQRKIPMTVRDCMTALVDVAAPDLSIAEAAKKMREGDFGALPIGTPEQILGLVTDRDIAIRAVAEAKDPNQTKVRDIMSPTVLFCYEDELVDQAVGYMGKNQVRRLPVMDREKHLVGILSLGDIAERKDCANQAREALTLICEHEHREPHEKAIA